MKKIFTFITLLMACVAIQAQNLTDLISDSYNGYVQIVITTADGDATSDPIPANVEIVKKEGNYIDFHLNNFILVSGADMMPVGNIVLSDIQLVAAERDGEVSFRTSQDINITEGDMEGVEMWMGPFLGPIPVDLKGDADSDFADIDIDINLEALGQVVHVDFIAGDRNAAVGGIEASAPADVPTYNVLGQRANSGLLIQNGRKFIRK